MPSLHRRSRDGGAGGGPLAVFRGEKGGPLADLAQLVGEEKAARRAPITFTVKEGKGQLKIGDGVMAEMEPYRGPTGKVTTLVESIFSTIPGSPAYVSKATRFRMVQPEIGVDLDLLATTPSRAPSACPPGIARGDDAGRGRVISRAASSSWRCR